MGTPIFKALKLTNFIIIFIYISELSFFAKINIILLATSKDSGTYHIFGTLFAAITQNLHIR